MLEIRKIAYVLSAAGILDSAYLLYSDIQPYCPVDACSTISIFTLPTYLPALFGLLWFSFSVIFFLIKSWNKYTKTVLLLWRYIGVYGIGFLGTYAVLNEYYCPYCFTAYILGAILIWISEKEL